MRERTARLQAESRIDEQDQEIRRLTEAPKRSAAEQHHYDTAKKCIDRFGEKAILSLRHLRTCETFTVVSPGMSNSSASTFLPSGVTLAEMDWALGACAGYGVVTYAGRFKSTDRTYEIPESMKKALDELLYGPVTAPPT